MFDAPAQLLKKRLGAADGVGRATHQTEQLALLGRPGATADRTFDENTALMRHRRSDGLHGVRPQCTHVDQDLARELPRQDAPGSTIDRVGCCIIQQHHDGCFAAPHEFRGRSEQACAGIG